MMNMIDMIELRILIADGSSVYKKMFAQAAKELNPNAAVTCVSQGSEAYNEIKRRNYDVIIADAEIPDADVFKFLNDAIRAIPKALVLITARPAIANSRLFAQALSKGAADHMIKPVNNSYAENLDAIKNKLTDIFKIIYDEHKKKSNQYGALPLSGVKKSAPESTATEKAKEKERKIIRKSRFSPGIVIIASSTGGPLALKTVLSQLNSDFPAPILVVQHMPPHFTETMTNHLNLNSKLKIKVAESREELAAGTVYTAPGGIHMKLDDKNKIYFDGSPPVNGVRPSADMLFESVAESFSGSGVLAVIMTGMGSDGQKGLARLKEKRECYCIAQSEKSCVVYGMPRAVVENGLADKVLDLEEIPRELESFNYNFSQEKS